MLVAVSSGWAGLKVVQFLLPPLLPNFVDALQITPAAAGLAISVIVFVSSVAQYFGGILSDQLNRRTLLVAGVAFSLCSVALFAATRQYAVFLLAAVTAGLAVGVYPPAALAFAADRFDERRGRAVGILTGAANLGGVVAAGIVMVLPASRWRLAFLLTAALILSSGLALHRLGTEPYRVARVDLDVGRSIRRVVGDRRLRTSLFVYALFSFASQGALSFLPAFLQSRPGISAALAQTGFGAVFAVGIVVKPLIGDASDRFDRVTLIIGVLAAGTVGLTGMIPSTSLLVLGPAVVLFAVGMMSFAPLIMSHLSTIVPKSRQGTDFGLARGIALGLGSLGPVSVGLVVTIYDYYAAFVGAAACYLIATVLATFLSE
jgi:MFS family permease